MQTTWGHLVAKHSAVVALACVCALVLSLVVTEASQAAGSSASKLVSCEKGKRASKRSALFEGAVKGSGKAALAIRFDLQAREIGAPTYEQLKGPGLGSWRMSTGAVGQLRYRKRVRNLAIGHEYRAAYSFRWFDTKRNVVRETTKFSKVCRQIDTRPDLGIGSLELSARPGGQAKYVAEILNDGPTRAGDFDVLLKIAGVARPAVTVDGLASKQKISVTFIAPRCKPGAQVEVRVDPDGRVNESDESLNSLSASCPEQLQGSTDGAQPID